MDLKVGAGTMKLLKENRRVNLYILGLDSCFLDMIWKETIDSMSSS